MAALRYGRRRAGDRRGLIGGARRDGSAGPGLRPARAVAWGGITVAGRRSRSLWCLGPSLGGVIWLGWRRCDTAGDASVIGTG
jgi:hypothetical protein